MSKPYTLTRRHGIVFTSTCFIVAIKVMNLTSIMLYPCAILVVLAGTMQILDDLLP